MEWRRRRKGLSRGAFRRKDLFGVDQFFKAAVLWIEMDGGIDMNSHDKPSRGLNQPLRQG